MWYVHRNIDAVDHMLNECKHSRELWNSIQEWTEPGMEN